MAREVLIEPAKGSIKKRKRKGRGNASGSGGECGRGHKGQKSRSGFKSKPGFEGGQTPLYRRLPKKNGMPQNPHRIQYHPINLDTLDGWFEEKEEVNLETLYQKGLIQKKQHVKILGNGKLSKVLNITAHKFSKSAIGKIKEAGAKLTIIEK